MGPKAALNIIRNELVEEGYSMEAAFHMGPTLAQLKDRKRTLRKGGRGATEMMNIADMREWRDARCIPESEEARRALPEKHIITLPFSNCDVVNQVKEGVVFTHWKVFNNLKRAVEVWGKELVVSVDGTHKERGYMIS